MRKLTQYFLWLYVFTLSWDNVPVRYVGSGSRAVGLAVISAAILTTMLQSRLRKPDAILGFAFAFSVWSVLSILWTISYPDTITRAYTYVQVVASAFVIREFVRTKEEVERLLVAFCLGAFVPLTNLLFNFWINAQYQSNGRFTATGLNPNSLGIMLVIGLPMAWHLLMRQRGIIRIIAVVYFALTPIALLLTATRGGFLAGIVALAIVPLTLPRQSAKTYALAGALLVTAAVSAALLAPQSSWDRIMTISDEATGSGDNLTGRMDIWTAGFQIYPEHPILGVGAAAYGAAVQPFLPRYTQQMNSHNTALGLLVEEGIVGLSLFGAIFAACAWTILQLRPPHRALWSVLLLTWFVGAMDGNFEHVKLTWALVGLISAQTGLTSVAESVRQKGTRQVSAMPTDLMQPAHLSGVGLR